MLIQSGHAHAQLPGDAGRGGVLPRAVDESRMRGRAQGDQPEVLLDRRIENQPLAFAILGHQPDAGGNGGVHIVAAQRRARDPHGAPIVGVGAEDGPRDLRATGAHETGDADDLSGAHLKADVLEDAVSAEPVDGQQSRSGIGPFARILLLDGPPDHEAHELVGGGVRGRLPDAAAVANDRDPIAQGGDLLEMVGDEHDADAFVPQRPHDGEQPVDLVGGEHRGRLVHDQHPRPQAQRLRDLDHLQPGYPEIAHAGARGYRQAHPLEQFGGVGLHGPAVDQPEAPRLPPEKDVLRDGQIRDQIELLIDRGDPEAFGVLCPGDANFLAVDQDSPAVGPVRAGQHLDQGALARTVLAQQHVHLAAAQIEVHAVECDHARERFADPLEAQQFRRWFARELAHESLLCSRTGSPHERRTMSRAGRATDCAGLPAMRSTRARTAARPSSSVGWAIAVMGGSV